VNGDVEPGGGAKVRKLIVSEFVSLDGVMEAPDQWHLQFWHDAMGDYKLEEVLTSGALLLGRVTYEGFAEAWPSVTDEVGFAEKMNSMPKFVVSTTLTEAEWNNSTLIKEDVVEEVARLKQQPGDDILVAGSADLVQTLMEHDVVDEYRLMVHPVVVGSGKRLFRDGSGAKTLRLVESKALGPNVLNLTYEPARDE
jgi:dihydrofolate reductase